MSGTNSSIPIILVGKSTQDIIQGSAQNPPSLQTNQVAVFIPQTAIPGSSAVNQNQDVWVRFNRTDFQQITSQNGSYGLAVGPGTIQRLGNGSATNYPVINLPANYMTNQTTTIWTVPKTNVAPANISNGQPTQPGNGGTQPGVPSIPVSPGNGGTQPTQMPFGSNNPAVSMPFTALATSGNPIQLSNPTRSTNPAVFLGNPTYLGNPTRSTNRAVSLGQYSQAWAPVNAGQSSVRLPQVIHPNGQQIPLENQMVLHIIWQ